MTIVPYIFQLPFIIQIQNKLGSLVFGFSLGLWVFGSLGLLHFSATIHHSKKTTPIIYFYD